MATHAKTPGSAHQTLVNELHGVLGKFASLPVLERVAMLGQVIGHLVAEVPDRAYTSDEIMHAVALNIASGNRQQAGIIASMIEGAKQ